MSRSIPIKSLVALVLLPVACAGGEGVGPSSTTRSISSTTTSIPAPATTVVSVTTTTQRTTTTEAFERGPELVTNGEFSSGTGSGSPVDWELNAPGEGQRAEHVTESDASHISLFAPTVETDQWPEAKSQPFPVAPHTDYFLMAEARTFTEGRLLLAMVFLDEDGDEILLRGIGTPAIPSSDWIVVDGTIESPATAASAYVVARLAALAGSSGEVSASPDMNMISVQQVSGA